MSRIQLLIIFFVSAFAANAQRTLPGRIMIAETTNPVASANIYLSSTSVGTVSDEKGNFILPRFPDGRYDLIVSCIGYETYHLSMRSDQLPSHLDIFLKPKVAELQEVILEAYDKEGWEKWGKLFVENFIGTSEFAEDCKIVNKDALRLRVSKKTNTLKVNATDQLVIENNALGYILKYDLTKFEYNIDTKEFVYGGYPFFEEMTTTKKGLQKRWIANRETAYNGSLMHFMRSVYHDRIKEEKFEVREWYDVPAAERKRIKDIYPVESKKVISQTKTVIQSSGRVFSVNEQDSTKLIDRDTLAYYQSIMKQIDQKNIFVDVMLAKKNIAFMPDSNTAQLKFRDHIEVVYTPKRNPPEYQKYISQLRMFAPVTSTLNRAAKEPVFVLANGVFFEGINLSTSGYWSWWEKICNKLPYDYQPSPAK